MNLFKDLYIFNSFKEFGGYIGDEWLHITSNHKDMERKIPDLEYIEIAYAYGEPLIFLKPYNNSYSIVMFIKVGIEISNISNTSPNYYYNHYEYADENSGKYIALKLINCVYNNSKDFISTVMDYIHSFTNVDIITIYSYEDLTTTFISPKWETITNRVCDLYDGEVGNVASDSLCIILPESLEVLLSKFDNNKKHQYNIKNIQRKMRRINEDFSIRSLWITPDNNIMLSESIINDLFSIRKNAWKDDLNYMSEPTIVRLLKYLCKNKKLFLHIIYADEHPVSYTIGIYHNNYIIDYTSSFNVKFQSYSFGKIAFINMLDKCIEFKCLEFECGGTTHKYKKDLINSERPAYETNLFNTNTGNGRMLYRIKKLYPKTYLLL